MGRETLHWFRLLTPGALAAFYFLTVRDPTLSVERIRSMFSQWEGLAVVICLLLGYPYRVLDVRRLFLSDFWKSINTNIEDTLVDITKSRRALTTAEESYLRDQRRLMDVFYRIIDNDESLKSKMSGIYFNGYLTTLGVDIVTVSALAAIAHGVAWAVSGTALHLNWVLGGAFVALLAWLLFKRSIKRHLALSNEQLRGIRNFYADKVCESAGNILRNLSPGTPQPP